ncbi:MAG TPA: hypothetical protein VGR37_23900 [Longimicrobiaceae bacterium]|nr:hypothetical protein [Longimicrobiaceae bacterium]
MSLEYDRSSRVAFLYLLYLAVRRGGYEFGGVRGWAHHDDIRWYTQDHFGDSLTRLALMGFLDREDMRHSRRQKPNWIYRIAERGVESIRNLEGVEPPPIACPGSAPAPGEARPVYVPAGALLAVRALRLVSANPTPSPLLPNEPGWRTHDELTALVCPPHEDEPEWKLDMLIGDLDELDAPAAWRAEREPRKPTRPRYFSNGDLMWLVRAGMAQRFGTIPEYGRRHTVLYRLTPLGAAIVPLEWREPTAEAEGDKQPEVSPDP